MFEQSVFQRKPDALIALNPEWHWQDFVQRSHQIEQQLRQDNIKSAAFWFEDAAWYACAMLACFNTHTKILLPPNLLAENQQWIDENADILFTDESIQTYGIHQPLTNTPLHIDFHSQTELWLKTSGSTGQPKILVKTAEKMWQESDAICQSLPFKSGGDLHVVSSVSAQHHYGLSYRIMLPLSKGWTISRKQLPYPEYLIAESLLAKQSLWISSPALLGRLNLADPQLQQCHITGILSSGGALPEQVADGLRQTLNSRIIEGYGSTETGVIAFRENNDDWTPTPVTEIGVNEEGALWVKNPWLDQVEQTADAVEIHQGKFKLLGRIDRIVKFGDKRISLVKIEQDLLKHQWVADCYVAQHPEHQRPAAWVALSADGIQAYKTLGRNKLLLAFRHYLTDTQEHSGLPRYWRFARELPRNSQSKISRADFDAIFLQPKNENFNA